MMPSISSELRFFVALLLVGCAVTSHGREAGAQDASGDLYAKRTNWDQPSGEGVNISSFVFRDLNLNGIYDMGDRPMAAIGFELSGNGKTETFRTNISGVANYKMSATLSDHDVTQPGLYRARVIIPPRWFTTTENNVEQTAVVESFPGSPADMVSRSPFKPVGLAPKLTITGHIQDATNPAADIHLRALSPKGEEREVAIGTDGAFTFDVERGRWTLVGQDQKTGEKFRRVVEVGPAPVYLSTIMLGRREPGRLPVRRLSNFDTVVVAADIMEIPRGYDGIGWKHFVATHNRTYTGEGYINNTMSGEYLAYNSSGHPIAAESDSPIDFVGGYFGLGWLKSEGEILVVKAWRQDKLVYQDQFELSALGPVNFDADYRGVTRVEFASKHFWQFVADDLTFGFAK